MKVEDDRVGMTSGAVLPVGAGGERAVGGPNSLAGRLVRPVWSVPLFFFQFSYFFYNFF
jgi:hypothetical protein